MNRRDFLKLVGVTVVAPSLPTPEVAIPRNMIHISEYAILPTIKSIPDQDQYVGIPPCIARESTQYGMRDYR